MDCVYLARWEASSSLLLVLGGGIILIKLDAKT